MSSVGDREILTQQRVIQFFEDALDYTYLGCWKDRDGNSNIEDELLSNWLKDQGHSDKIIGKVLHEVGKAKALGAGARRSTTPTARCTDCYGTG